MVPQDGDKVRDIGVECPPPIDDAGERSPDRLMLQFHDGQRSNTLPKVMCQCREERRLLNGRVAFDGNRDHLDHRLPHRGRGIFLGYSIFQTVELLQKDLMFGVETIGDLHSDPLSLTLPLGEVGHRRNDRLAISKS